MVSEYGRRVECFVSSVGYTSAVAKATVRGWSWYFTRWTCSVRLGRQSLYLPNCVCLPVCVQAKWVNGLHCFLDIIWLACLMIFFCACYSVTQQWCPCFHFFYYLYSHQGKKFATASCIMWLVVIRN